MLAHILKNDGVTPSPLSAAGDLIGRCFEIRNEAHKAHLATHSYAEHMALGSFYSDIIGLADSIAEGIQGRSGQLLGAYGSFRFEQGASILSKLTQFRSWIDQNRAAVSSASEIQNDIDTLLGLINSTIYKLVNLT